MADSAAQKKPGFASRVKRFFKDIAGECKKVVWPTKKQVLNNTAIVAVVVVAASILVSCLDIVASFLIKGFVSFL